MASTANNSAGKWEVVKKNKKSNNSEKKSGGSRKALGESNMPKIDPAPPLKTSDTIYELGFDKVAKKQNKEQVPPAFTSEEQQQKKPNMGKQAKKSASADAGQKPYKYKSLEDALKDIDLTELQQQLEKSQSLFPANPSVWVKDLAGYLNYKLQVLEADPMLSQHSYDYPYSLVGKELKNLIRSLLGKSGDAVEHLFDHCIYIMLRDQDKAGESLYGYRICIQAVLQDKPKIATMNLPKYLELLRSHQNRPLKCLSIMWSLGQAGFADLTEGLKVWLGIMLPVLGVKSLSSYAIGYLDRLLMMHPNLTKGFGMIGPKDFFPVLDFAFMPNNSLSASLQEQLQHLYPRLKVLAFGGKPESTLHTYFPSFLSRATPNCPEDMKKELLNCMSECLNMDPLSFSVWRQLYTKHLSQSSLLLNHLLESWDSTSRKMQKSLQETVHSFKVTNEELSAKGQSSVQDIAACNAACNNLLHKMRGRGFPWHQLLLMCLIFIVGFVMHDIRSHGSFKASSSARMLQQTGVMSVSQQSWNKISHYSQEGYSWLETNAPHYYTQILTTLGPNLEVVWNKTSEAAIYITEKCSAQITWIKENFPRFIEWLHASLPDAALHFFQYIKELLLFIHQNYLLPVKEYIQTGIEQAWKRFVDSCKGEVSWPCVNQHLMNITQSTWAYLQNTTISVKNRALALLSKQ
ncbi:transmembrane protein 214 [Latimeria chalumnae]|nr:PREDICTED: transmembrane protein 214 [Latimeria chalumnae]|eukprot:XP_005990959.1 PREDICTED: transmembrane protein 214 [Latimeria chalumnae]